MREMGELFFKTDVEELEKIKGEPCQIFIGSDDLYLRFYNLGLKVWDEVSLKEVEDIGALNEYLVKRNYPI